MKTRLGITGLGLALAAVAGPVWAQIEEIVVTAQRREEQLQDVPLAVSAFGADQIEALQIDVDLEMLIERISKRAAEEGRSDDTEEVVRKRMQVYEEQTAPVVEYYARKGLLSRVLGDGTVDEVFQRIKGVLQIRAA